MSDYVVLAWPEGGEAQAEILKQGLAAEGRWRLAVDSRRLAVFLSLERPLPLLRLPGQIGVIIGSVFDTQAALQGRGRQAEIIHPPRRTPEELGAHLVASIWGAYVAVLPDGDGLPNVLRDPLGGLECLTWRRGGVSVIASRLTPGAAHAPEILSIDWGGVARLLRQKNLSSVTTPLNGVEAVDPGVLHLARGGRLRLWRPSDFAGRRAARARVAPEDLARVVDGCVAAWALGRRGVLCEISGGLDSAIVVAALRRAGAPITAGLNHYWAEPEADERAFARDVAKAAQIVLTERAHGLLLLDPAKLALVADAARPSFSGADPHYDADMADRLAQPGVDCLFTGQGGDGVFYQMATADLAGDLLRGAPSGLGFGQALSLLAHRTRRTAWDLLAEALATWRAPLTPHAPVSFLTDAAAISQAQDRHPWLSDLDAISPAKRVQIQAITNNQSMFGDSLRARAGRLIQPLLSQPVVELCLAIPAPRLAIGLTDRPFARAAFGDRLPLSVRQRRGKGDLSVFFAQSMAASLPFLRPFLLEGRLAAQGLIDPARLEPLLSRDELIWFDHSGELTIAAILEAWARRWEASLSAP